MWRSIRCFKLVFHNSCALSFDLPASQRIYELLAPDNGSRDGLLLIALLHCLMEQKVSSFFDDLARAALRSNTLNLLFLLFLFFRALSRRLPCLLSEGRERSNLGFLKGQCLLKKAIVGLQWLGPYAFPFAYIRLESV